MIEFRLLGPVEVVRDGDAVALGGARQRTLLALLLSARGQAVPADRIADELWHGNPPAGAATTVRSYVSRLRSVLAAGAEISGTTGGYRLDAGSRTVDAERFERLLDEGRAALAGGASGRAAERLQQALALWRGKPFGDVGDEGSLKLEAERLEHLRLLALESRVEAELALGRSTELVGELEKLVGEQPYHEPFWRQLMLALYRAGRQADALAAYRRARTVLDEELGLEPSEELRRLEQAVLRHEVPDVARPVAGHNLPVPLNAFVGREAELAELERLLGHHRLVTVSGVGGAGKTRLALEAATRAQAHFSGGASFCDLSPLRDPTLVVHQAARALDVHDRAGLEIEDVLVERLRETELLLVLDNCEHVREPCAALAQRLLEGCRNLRILATSREPLGVPGELDYAVPPLSLPPAEAPAEELAASEAVQLFLARARDVRPRLAADESVLEQAARIARDLDGLPLAIELAAARAKALSLEEIATRLADRFRFLVSWRRLAAARHRTLREAIDWSYELLEDEERALLARLAVFSGGFTLEAVAATCLGGDEERALRLLERLVEASLIVAEEEGGAMRYRLLETVRQYAAERLYERGETDELRGRHAAFFLELVEGAHDLRADMDQWLGRIAVEQDNLRVALTWARDAGDARFLLHLTGEIWRFWWVRGEIAEGRGWLALALGLGTDAPAELRLEALEGAAGLAWAHGDMAAAGEIAGTGLAIARQLGELPAEAGFVTVLGHVALAREDFATAGDYFERGRELGEETNFDSMVAVALHNLGSVAFGSGDLELSAARYREALSIYSASGSEYGIALSELYLGLVAVEAGEYEDAAGCLGRALHTFRQMRFPQYASQCLDGIAAVVRARGDASEAVRLTAAADAVRSRTGQAPTVAARRRERELQAARAELSDTVFATAWNEGAALRERDALDRAERAVSG